jgi:hypothetical protein
VGVDYGFIHNLKSSVYNLLGCGLVVGTRRHYANNLYSNLDECRSPCVWGGGGRELFDFSELVSLHHQRDLTHLPPTKLAQMDVNRTLYPVFVNFCALYDLLQQE